MHRIVSAAWRAAPMAAAAACASACWVGAAPVARADALSKTEWRKFTLSSKTQLSSDSAEYRFEFPAGHTSERLGLEPASLLLVRANVDGEVITRPYTPVSTADTVGHMRLVVKAYEQGKVSKHIGGMAVGEALEVKGPIQKFKYERNMKKYIGMIAGGSGITPMLQLIEAILADGRDNTELRLIFANKTPEDVLLKARLDALAWKHSNFKVLYTVDKGDDDWQGETGFVNEDMIRAVLPPPVDDSLILVCGPPPMVKHVAGAKKGYQQGDLSGLLAHMGYSKDMVFKY